MTQSETSADIRQSNIVDSMWETEKLQVVLEVKEYVDIHPLALVMYLDIMEVYWFKIKWIYSYFLQMIPYTMPEL